MSQVAEKMEMVEVPVDQLFVPDIQMRKVNEEGEKFIGLVNSIRDHGLLQPIGVMEITKDREAYSKGFRYELLFGFHRRAAMSKLGWLFYPAIIQPKLDEGDARFVQLIENFNREEAKPMDCAHQLERILADPKFMGMKMPQILEKIGLKKTPQWVYGYIKLKSLHKDLHEVVNGGFITLTNARQLARLPVDIQKDWKDRAMETPLGDFKVAVESKLRTIRAEREGKTVEKDPFAGSKSRKVAEVKRLIVELNSQNNTLGDYALNDLISETKITDKKLVSTIRDIAFKFATECVAYTISMDKAAVDSRKKRDELNAEQRELNKKLKESAMDEIKNVMQDPEKLAKLKAVLAQIKNG